MSGLAPLNTYHKTTFKRLFGEWHRLKRKELGLTQVELAVELDMTSMTVSHIERGASLPRDMVFHMEMLAELERRMKGR